MTRVVIDQHFWSVFNCFKSPILKLILPLQLSGFCYKALVLQALGLIPGAIFHKQYLQVIYTKMHLHIHVVEDVFHTDEETRLLRFCLWR